LFSDFQLLAAGFVMVFLTGKNLLWISQFVFIVQKGFRFCHLFSLNDQAVSSCNVRLSIFLSLISVFTLAAAEFDAVCGDLWDVVM
jgi:hypothetical protein